MWLWRLISVLVLGAMLAVLVTLVVREQGKVDRAEADRAAKAKSDPSKVVAPGDTVAVEYTGRLEDGEIFDATERHGGEPLKFEVGAGQMIKGFDRGVIGMKVGETRTLTIPPEDAYGVEGDHELAGKTLTFEVKLVRLTKGR